MATRLEHWLRESALRARARCLHALMRGDFGGAIIAELDWRDRRESWVEIMERQRWDRAVTRARIAAEEQDSDARCRAVLEDEPRISLTELLTRLQLDRRTWVERHLRIGHPAT